MVYDGNLDGDDGTKYFQVRSSQQFPLDLEIKTPTPTPTADETFLPNLSIDHDPAFEDEPITFTVAVADSTNSARVPDGRGGHQERRRHARLGPDRHRRRCQDHVLAAGGDLLADPGLRGNSDFKGSQQDPTTLEVTPNPAFFSTVMLVPFPVTANQTTTFSAATISNGTQGGTSIPTGEVDIRNGAETIGSE